MKKIVIALISSGICTSACSGFFELTSHSRANCINNESITWDGSQPHKLHTYSAHTDSAGKVHVLESGPTNWEITYRSAAVHWGEALPGAGWTVAGSHWEEIDGAAFFLKQEIVTDCSIYDGWWDTKYKSLSNDKKNVNTLNDVKQTSYERFKKIQNFPKGIAIVLEKDSMFPIERKKRFVNGDYEQSNSPYITHLLTLNEKKKESIVDNNDPYDTHLKSNLSFIKLAFPFKKIPFLYDKDVIGYAVGGGWIKDKNGWTGISEFFNYKNVGVCKYNKMNYVLSNGGAQLIKELITYEVDGYPTTKSVKGQEKLGFIYSVHWFDKEYFNNLDCATRSFSNDIAQKVMDLANRISTGH